MEYSSGLQVAANKRAQLAESATLDTPICCRCLPFPNSTVPHAANARQLAAGGACRLLCELASKRVAREGASAQVGCLGLLTAPRRLFELVPFLALFACCDEIFELRERNPPILCRHCPVAAVSYFLDREIKVLHLPTLCRHVFLPSCLVIACYTCARVPRGTTPSTPKASPSRGG